MSRLINYTALCWLSSICLFLSGCGAIGNPTPVTGPPPDTKTVTVLNHIIFLAQENRSFDHYFGALRGYWAQNGYPDQSFDGLPQFNPSSGAAPLFAPAPAIPGCDPKLPPPADCVFDFAFNVPHGTLDAIFVHFEVLLLMV